MKSTIFIVWIVAITALSVMPYSKNGTVSLKLTGSGMILHFIAYFAASALIYWVFIKGPQIAQITVIKKDTLFSILIPSFTIFMFSVVLETAQYYLPYRTFNPIDIAANASGRLFFVLIWISLWKRGMRRWETQDRKGPQISRITPVPSPGATGQARIRG